VSRIHAFRFESVSKQLICHSLDFFKSNLQKIEIKSQIESPFESNLRFKSNLKIGSNRDLNPISDCDLPITGSQCHYITLNTIAA